VARIVVSQYMHISFFFFNLSVTFCRRCFTLIIIFQQQCGRFLVVVVILPFSVHVVFILLLLVVVVIILFLNIYFYLYI
jgi:hypothetical protein